MCESDSVSPQLQTSALFKWVLKFICWQGFSKKWMITVVVEKFPPFNFILFKRNWSYLKEKHF